jgi:translation initiation factor IF-2
VIKTSATQGIGIDDLLEHLSTLSELLEFKADPTLAAYGHVIEAEMKAGVGPVARVLIQDGSLRRGQFIVCGPGFGKVRSIKDDQGRDLEIAGPSMPVEVSGLDDLPSAGDELFQVESLRRAEDIAKQVKQQLRRSSLSTVSKPKTLEELFGQKQAGTIPELGVILKADMQGSVDVLRKTLTEIPSNEVRVDVLHSGVGAINESDVLLAEASGALVVGFQVVPEAKVQRLADEKGVDVRMYRVIYDLLDDIKQALEGLLEPEQKVERRGEAEVRDVFKYGKVGSVAGCYVRDGSFTRQYLVRVIRDGVVVRDAARLTSLRRYKDDVKEVKAGYECGMKIEGFDDVKPGDVLESYEIVKVARKLQVSS